jgi:hypothetical protein
MEVEALRTRLWKIDWSGLVAFVGSTVSLLFGITSGGVLYPWKSASIIVPLVIGFLGVVAFLFIEAFVSPNPMIPLGIFRDHNAKIDFLHSFCHGFIILLVNYYLILYVSYDLSSWRAL